MPRLPAVWRRRYQPRELTVTILRQCRSATLRRLGGERGSVTAEFVVVLPAVLMVFALTVGSIMLATQRLTLSSAAAELARLEARGDYAAAATRLNELTRGVAVHREVRDALLCITLTSRTAPGALSLITVESRGCAARIEDTR